MMAGIYFRMIWQKGIICLFMEGGIRLGKTQTVGKSRCGIHWCSLYCFFSNISIDLSFLKYKLNFGVRLLFLPSFSFWWACSIRLGTLQFCHLVYTHFIYSFWPIHVFYVSYFANLSSSEIIYVCSHIFKFFVDFPRGSDSKASAYNAGDPGSIPGLGRFSTFQILKTHIWCVV